MAAVFDAGANGNGGYLGGTSATTTWTHTATPGAGTVVLVALWTIDHGSYSSSVTYGGTAMSLVGRVKTSAGNSYAAEIWQLSNPPGGAQTVSATSSTNDAAGTMGCSVSYTGCAVGSSFLTNVGTSGTSLSVPGLNSSKKYFVLAAKDAGGAVTSPNFTQRASRVYSGAWNIVGGDISSASTASCSSTDSANWGMCAVDLVDPPVAANFFSMF